MKKIERDAAGYPLRLADINKAIAVFPEEPLLAIGRAYVRERGVRLTATEVNRLVGSDDAVAHAIYNAVEDARGILERQT